MLATFSADTLQGRFQILDRMSQRSFATLTEYERIVHGKQRTEFDNSNGGAPPVPLATAIKWVNAAVTPKPNTTGEEVSLLLHLIKESSRDLDSLFPGHICTVVVFYMPGTFDQTPLFLSEPVVPGCSILKWDQPWVSGQEETRREAMQARISNVADRLRRHDHQKFQVNDTDPINGREYDADNFFFCAFLHAKAMGWHIAQNRTVSHIASLSGTAGFSGSTLWACPKEENLEFTIPKAAKTGHITTKWCRRHDSQYSPVVASPVFVNDSSMVLVASFFSQEEFDAIRDEANTFANFLFCHRLCSTSVFGNLYGGLMRSAMGMLRGSLERSQVSPSLLATAAEYLHSPSYSPDAARETVEPFGYRWEEPHQKDKSEQAESDDVRKPFTCAHFEADLYGNVLHNPEKVFDRVLTIESQIYRRLACEWKSCCSSFTDEDFPLPPGMPLANVLKTFEETNRALKTTARDHVIHMFQVFLLGSLIIRKHEGAFRKRFKESLQAGEFETWVLKDREPTDKECDYLLKLAWFLCSTLHDVGYPVQMVDGTISGLKRHVADLLGLERGRAQNGNGGSDHRIDEVLYDDPRAYIVLKDVTNVLADMRGDGNQFAGWWYFIRNLAFEQKRHAVASIIALAMSILRDADESHSIGAAEVFLQDDFGRFLATHVFVPILVHHSCEWDKRDKEIVGKYGSSERTSNSHVVEKHPEAAEDKQRREAKLKTIEAALERPRWFYRSGDVDRAQKRRSFSSKCPLADLLAFCDFLQETGRPAGDRRPDWPAKMIDKVHFGEENTPLRFDLRLLYDGPDIDACRSNIDEKKATASRLQEVFELDLVRDVDVVISGWHQHEGYRGDLTHLDSEIWTWRARSNSGD